jgi:hypothetical protein
MVDRQINEEMILREEVSDEAVEAAAFVARGGLPTLMHNTYCYACPAIHCEAIQPRREAHLSFDPSEGPPSAAKRLGR